MSDNQHSTYITRFLCFPTFGSLSRVGSCLSFRRWIDRSNKDESKCSIKNEEEEGDGAEAIQDTNWDGFSASWIEECVEV